MVLAIRIAWPCIAALWCLTIKVAIAESPPTPTQEQKPTQNATHSAQSPFDESVATAKRLMSEHRYEAALVEWKSAYSHREQPWLLLEQARCEHQLGHQRSASVLYKRFLLVVDSGPQRDEAERELAQVREELQKPVASGITAAEALPSLATTPLASSPSLSAPVLLEIAKDDDIQLLSIGHEKCKLPCRLRVDLGPHIVVGTGKENFVSHYLVDGPGKLRIERDRAGHRVAGGVLIPSGVVFAASFWSTNLLCPSGSDACGLVALIAGPVVGVGALLTGIGLLTYASGASRHLQTDGQARRANEKRNTPRFVQFGVGPIQSGASISSAVEF